MSGEELVNAALIGDKVTVNQLLGKGIDVNYQNPDGDTALMIASWKGHMGVVKRLLECKEITVNLKNTYDGNTALSMASQNGHLYVVNRLLE